MVICPIVWVFYWICACDTDFNESCHLAEARPSLQVLYSNFYDRGEFQFLCIDTNMCSCLRYNQIGSTIVALMLFVFFTIPLFMAIMVIAVGFCATVGTFLGILALISYLIRVAVGVIRLTIT